MKRALFLIVLVCSVLPAMAAAAAAVPDASSATAAAQVGININPAGISVASGQVGINGLALRFVDVNGSGIELPLGITYNNTIDSGAVYPHNTAFSVSSGIKFIRPFYSNDFFRISAVPGIAVSYTATFENYDNNLAKDIYSTYSAGVSAVGGIEGEVFVDKAFSLPRHSLSLATGLNLSLGFNFGETIDNFTDKTDSSLDARNYSRKFVYSAGLSSFGTTLSTITVRYYF